MCIRDRSGRAPSPGAPATSGWRGRHRRGRRPGLRGLRGSTGAPVSYTHLDVYKRQGWGRLRTCSSVTDPQPGRGRQEWRWIWQTSPCPAGRDAETSLGVVSSEYVNSTWPHRHGGAKSECHFHRVLQTKGYPRNPRPKECASAGWSWRDCPPPSAVSAGVWPCLLYTSRCV